MLPGTGLRHHAGGADTLGQQRLSDGIVDFVAPVCARSSRFSHTSAPQLIDSVVA